MVINHFEQKTKKILIKENEKTILIYKISVWELKIWALFYFDFLSFDLSFAKFAK